jgi:hypothetical protein
MQPSEPSIHLVQEALAVFFSWFILAAVAIIISGKLLAKRFSMGFVQEDKFRIPLLIFDIRARGDEVSLGLLAFLGSFAVWLIFGGKNAYEFFRDHAGIDIGQWNSLCVMASFSALFLCLIMFIVAPLVGSQPVVSEEIRAEVISKLERLKNG